MRRTKAQLKARNNFHLEINELGFPIAHSHDDGHQAIVECCPLCGERHLHGSGSEYGHRVSHCVPDNQKKWVKLHPEVLPYISPDHGYYLKPDDQ